MRRPRRDTGGTLHVGPRAPSVAVVPSVLATVPPLLPAGPITPTRTVRLGARMTFHGHDWHHAAGRMAHFEVVR